MGYSMCFSCVYFSGHLTLQKSGLPGFGMPFILRFCPTCSREHAQNGRTFRVQPGFWSDRLGLPLRFRLLGPQAASSYRFSQSQGSMLGGVGSMEGGKRGSHDF